MLQIRKIQISVLVKVNLEKIMQVLESLMEKRAYCVLGCQCYKQKEIRDYSEVSSLCD
jgi:hypothetical protein